MNKFDKVYNEFFKLKTLHIKPKQIQKCKYEQFILSKHDIVLEMQNKYPIPKDVLSYYIEKVFKNGFSYVEEFSINHLIELIESSDNLKDIKFNLENIKKIKNHNLLFICLPYNLTIWKTELNDKINCIENLFKEFDNSPGVSGDYSNGKLIIINSDFLNTLKDIEEVVEHEFVHLFEDIDDVKNSISKTLEFVLQNPNEFKTYSINLMNRLENLFNKILIKDDLKDSNEQRIKFLNEIFKDAFELNYVELTKKYSYYDSSKLLLTNMWFLNQMCRWQPDEYEEFKKDIYDHFEWL